MYLKKNVYIIFKLHISQSSANGEEESERSEKEKHTSDGEDVETDEEEEEEAPAVQYGVTPFLCGVLPAGRLRATTKPVGCQASGLIQVGPYHFFTCPFSRWGTTG